MSNVSVLIECNGRTYRVIDNLREFVDFKASDSLRVSSSVDRCRSEARIGRKVLDLAREVEVKQ
jgi:hypothetical protein